MSDNPVDIGQEFKDKRLSLNTTLDKAAKDTKISKSYLLAIEANEFDRIPNEIVAKGFLQIYSDYLGIDPKHILAELKKRTKKHVPATQSVRPQKTPPENKDAYYRSAGTAIISLLLTILIFWGLFALFNSIKAPHPEKSRPAAEVSSGISISVEIIDKTWMRALADGRQVFESVFFPGDTQNIEAKKNIVLKIGNAAAVKVLSEGKILYGGGKAGQVITKEFSK